MSILQELLSECIRSPEELRYQLHLTDQEVAELTHIADQYPICIPPYYLNLIGSDWKHDPVRKLCIPDPMESSTDGHKDTSGEGGNTVVTGMQHKYRQTALILTTNQCSMYCRHCFRKRMVGSNADEIATHLGEMVDYVMAHPEIDNVLLSGGDALINENERLRQYLEAFSKIDNLHYIRIGTRVPVVLPRRILWDMELLEILREYNRRKQIIIVTHFNHPNEITDDARNAIRTLIQTGCPVRNQTVIRRETGLYKNPSCCRNSKCDTIIKKRILSIEKLSVGQNPKGVCEMGDFRAEKRRTASPPVPPCDRGCF